MTYPVFASGDVLNAADMNGVGLWLVKSQAVGTGVSSVTVTGAFSADYDNYKVIYSGGTCTLSHVLTFQLKVGGGSTSTTGYSFGLAGATYANAAVTVGGSNTTSIVYGGGGDTWTEMDMTVYDPFKASVSKFWNPVWFATYAATNTGVHTVATSYADCVITPTSGTLTGGTIRVYGFRN